METKDYHLRLSLYYEDYKEESMQEKDFIISLKAKKKLNQPPIFLRKPA